MNDFDDERVVNASSAIDELVIDCSGVDVDRFTTVSFVFVVLLEAVVVDVALLVVTCAPSLGSCNF